MPPPRASSKPSSKPPERTQNPAPAPFVPSAEWQAVPPGTPIPPGAEIRMSLDAGAGPGGVVARWPAEVVPGAEPTPVPEPGTAHGEVPDEAGPFAGRPDTDPARLAYSVAHRHGFPFLRLRSGRTFGAGEGAWWRDVGRAEGERDTEALYRVVRHFDLGDEDGPAPSGLAPERPAADTGREETDR